MVSIGLLGGATLGGVTHSTQVESTNRDSVLRQR